VFAKLHRRSLDCFFSLTPTHCPLSPNSNGITSFADPHPLTPLESHRFKIIKRGHCFARVRRLPRLPRPSRGSGRGTSRRGGPQRSNPNSPISYLASVCPSKSFRMNTCKSVSKQKTLTTFRINTYEKHRGRGSYCSPEIPQGVPIRPARQERLGLLFPLATFNFRLSTSARSPSICALCQEC
jgi:hypothetical protein